MTAHTHETMVDGCYRCELNIDELPDCPACNGGGYSVQFKDYTCLSCEGTGYAKETTT